MIKTYIIKDSCGFVMGESEGCSEEEAWKRFVTTRNAGKKSEDYCPFEKRHYEHRGFKATEK